jgi:peptide/nickel transport system substrate-binding protein
MKASRLKRFLALTACLAVLCSCLTGCGGSSSSSSSSSSDTSSDTSSATTESTGSYKETITIGLPEDITNTDPQESNATMNLILQQCIHDRLISLNSDGTFSCDLAESYDQVSDTVWQFNLRQGVKFHNGAEMTAEDVVYTFERAKTSSAANDKVEMISEVRAVDDYTVEIELTDQISDILYYIAYPTLGILCKEAVESDPENGPQIGAGPYVFDEWSTGDKITLHAFEDYYKGEKPTKNLVMRIVPEASSRVIALQTGEIDICVDPSAVELSHISEDSSLDLLQVSSERLHYLAFNMSGELFGSNQLLRQAIAMAINKDDIISVATEGLGTPATTFFSPGYGYYDGYDPYSYNPEKAKELLAEAGYPDGLEFTIYYNGNLKELMSQVIQSNLKEIGITVNIEKLEISALKSKLASGDYDAAVYNWANDSAGPDNNVRPLFRTGSSSNRTHFSDSYIDDLMDEALKETDSDKRLEMYQEIQTYILDECPLVPCFYETISVGINKDLQNFSPDTSGLHRFYDCYIIE